MRIHVRIYGRVQGVFFRASTQEQAQKLGLDGWVRNRGDGSVEVVAEGAPHQVHRLLAWVQHGPPMARVDSIEVVECESVGLQGGFDVRPSV